MPTADFQRLLEERGGSSKDIIIIIIIIIFIIGVVSGGLLTFLNVFFSILYISGHLEHLLMLF